MVLALFQIANFTTVAHTPNLMDQPAVWHTQRCSMLPLHTDSATQCPAQTPLWFQMMMNVFQYHPIHTCNCILKGFKMASMAHRSVRNILHPQLGHIQFQRQRSSQRPIHHLQLPVHRYLQPPCVGIQLTQPEFFWTFVRVAHVLCQRQC